MVLWHCLLTWKDSPKSGPGKYLHPNMTDDSWMCLSARINRSTPPFSGVVAIPSKLRLPKSVVGTDSSAPQPARISTRSTTMVLNRTADRSWQLTPLLTARDCLAIHTSRALSTDRRRPHGYHLLPGVIQEGPLSTCSWRRDVLSTYGDSEAPCEDQAIMARAFLTHAHVYIHTHTYTHTHIRHIVQFTEYTYSNPLSRPFFSPWSDPGTSLGMDPPSISPCHASSHLG